MIGHGSLVKLAAVQRLIHQLEKQVEQETQALIEVSVKGDGDSIKRLTRSIHESKERINSLFNELEAVTGELDTRSREFEERFEELKAAGR